jgi:nucleoside-diphosphate-sugar epimerase
MPQYTALIAGATGAIGGALAAHLAGDPKWLVRGICRKKPARPIAGVEYILADLMDAKAARTAIAPHGDITHVFFCGRAPHDDRGRESVENNVIILANLIDAAEAASAKLAHVNLVQGGKYYGVHLGAFPNPAREDDSRTATPNFYYDQEDLLRTRSKDAAWNWSAARPNTLLHFSPGNPRNLVSTLGAYAAICRELGLALDFPSTEGGYTSLVQVTNTEILSHGMAWMSTEPRAANNAFNITNGDVFRWSRLWPQLAAAFDMPCGVIRPMVLADVMAEREAVWQRIVEKHGLTAQPLSAVAIWAFADATLIRWWDEIMSTNKARSLGFHDWADSEHRLLALINQYREAKILP